MKNYFGPAFRRDRLLTETIAGITTFFTMSYIVIVNPLILSTPGTGMPFGGVLTATVALTALMTLLMGLYAKLPYAVAPGMGINAFFTFNLILGRHLPWPVALGTVFWAGVIFVAVSVTPVRVWIANAIPGGIRIGTAAGIGIFLTFIGLKNAGLVVSDPVTLVRLGTLDHKAVFTLLGAAITCGLMVRKNPLAFLAGIIAVTALAGVMGDVTVPPSIVSWPDFGTVALKLDIWGALKPALAPAIIAILFTDLFDSISTFVGVAQASGLLDKKGEPIRLKEGLIVDAFATLGAGLLGTSSGTAYIESAAGIEMGGRSGFTSLVTGLCFIPCFFLGPLAGMVPAFATAPVLILVGALMFRSVSGLRLERLEEIIPPFVTMILIPLTFSITQGILWGFISHVGMFLLSGRRREIPPLLYGLAALSVALLWLEHGGHG
jgi:AGZA family xanthine/uracil permease-like MFS transporter